jgi:hypothetical protein
MGLFHRSYYYRLSTPIMRVFRSPDPSGNLCEPAESRGQVTSFPAETTDSYGSIRSRNG